MYCPEAVTIIICRSRTTKRRDNDGDDEDEASRDNTDAAPTPDNERSGDSKYLSINATLTNTSSTTVGRASVRETATFH